MIKNICRIIGNLVPLRFRSKTAELIRYLQVKYEPEVFIGFVAIVSFIVGLVAGGIGFLLEKSFLLFFLIATAVTNAIIYSVTALIVDMRARMIEESLPDALQLMSSNLRSGMTPDKALLFAARPEFGPLKAEIDFVGKNVTLGKSVGTALLEMSMHIRSRKLVRAVELINGGLESGGSLANLLDATAAHLRDAAIVDKKIKAAITMYIIFIFSAAAIITPILLGLTSVLVEILRSSIAQIDIPTSATAALPISVGKIQISAEFIRMYIIIFLVVNGFLASSLLGLIAKGRQREGLRYYVPLLILAIPLFLLSRYAIQTLLSGLFKF
ncbi:type II secretion system F family protein [Candidatus Woesearchaeota archaeon]|nr:type II secretion system F family protein [Candidatus Woesearchaeota archaeon]